MTYIWSEDVHARLDVLQDLGAGVFDLEHHCTCLHHLQCSALKFSLILDTTEHALSAPTLHFTAPTLHFEHALQHQHFTSLQYVYRCARSIHSRTLARSSGGSGFPEVVVAVTVTTITVADGKTPDKSTATNTRESNLSSTRMYVRVRERACVYLL